MTSRINYFIPACLLVVLISLSFVNVAYADSPIWRESNNLYNSTPFNEVYQNQSSPYRLFLLRDYSALEGGQEYSLSFNLDSSSSYNTFLAININGNWQYSNLRQSNQITFELPDDYQTMSIYLGSQEEISVSQISQIMLNVGGPLPYEPPYSGFRFDFGAIAQMIGQYVQPILETILPYIFMMIALIIGISAGLRVFRKTTT